jgi:hypothetical protein
MADLDRVKRNISRMISMNAPETDIDQYIASEGASLEEVRAHKIQQPTDMGSGAQAAAAPQRPAYSSVGDAVVGGAKALGTGFAQGMVGLATLPGNLETLGRAAINTGAGAFGIAPPVSPEPWAINYNDAKSRLEAKHGQFYKPQTTAEEYLRTFGEFAPAAMGGGASAGAKLAQVAAPAVLSETAGQLTKGGSYEPLARAAGGLFGGMLTNTGARAVTPVGKVSSVRAQNVKELERQGVTSLLAGQKTDSKMTRALEDASVSLPGGGRTISIQDKGMEEFTRSALKNIGVDDSVYPQFNLSGPRATDEVLGYAADQIGKRFENVAKVAKVVPDKMFDTRLKDVVQKYTEKTSQGNRVPAIQAYAKEIATEAGKSGGMTGEKYLAIRRALREDQRSGDGPLRDAAGRLVEQLDAQMIRSAPKNIRPQVAKYIQDNNRQWRDYLAIRNTMSRQGEVSSAGLISPQSLNAEIKKQHKNNLVTRNNRDLGKLARAGDDAMRPLKSSGTAERGQAMKMLTGPSAVLSTMGGALASGGDPLTTILAGATPFLLQAGTARGVSNPTFQKYLANQLLPRRVPSDRTNRLARAAISPLMLTRDDLKDDPQALGRFLATQR